MKYTTVAVEKDLADDLRDAIRVKYPHAYGKIKEEINIMVKNHIKLLKGI